MSFQPTDLLWMLLPVAALSGWFAARRYAKNSIGRKARSSPHSGYYKGLEYLINEQQDKALEAFTQMLEVTEDTVETHLALGGLFRRKGEVDRAIHVHQNLIARSGLDSDQRANAVYELGLDYMRAGLFDRAEGLFCELIEDDRNMDRARVQLLEVYQKEKEWTNAIDVAKLLLDGSGASTRKNIAHFYCEVAALCWADGDSGGTREALQQALETDPECIRAILVKADYQLASGDYVSAIRNFERVIEVDPEYVSEVVKPMVACFRAEDDLPGARRWLEDLLDRRRGTTVLLALSELLEEQEGVTVASKLLTDHLHRWPSLRGLERVISLRVSGLEEDARAPWTLLSELILKLRQRRPRYQCHHCGFSGKKLYWQCPGCKTWGDVKPIELPEDE